MPLLVLILQVDCLPALCIVDDDTAVRVLLDPTLVVNGDSVTECQMDWIDLLATLARSSSSLSYVTSMDRMAQLWGRDGEESFLNVVR